MQSTAQGKSQVASNASRGHDVAASSACRGQQKQPLSHGGSLHRTGAARALCPKERPGLCPGCCPAVGAGAGRGSLRPGSLMESYDLTIHFQVGGGIFQPCSSLPQSLEKTTESHPWTDKS